MKIVRISLSIIVGMFLFWASLWAAVLPGKLLNIASVILFISGSAVLAWGTGELDSNKELS